MQETTYLLGLHLREQTFALRQSVDELIHRLLEPVDAARFALHMLAKPAEGTELGFTPLQHGRAMVELLCMRGTVQVLVQRRKRCERAMAHVALIVLPVPRPLRRPSLDDRAAALRRWLADEVKRVRDDAALVEA